MNKEQQIREIENIIKAEYEQWLDTTGVIPKATTYYAECLGCAIDSAKALYNAGYRKVPEDAIVLTKEELDKLHIFDDEMFERILNYEREKGRKETAKEILILLGKGFDEMKMTEFKNLPWYKLFCRELKHRYGVEVEE